MGFIYLIRNKINGKGYVGQTKRPIEKRWEEHIRDSDPNNFNNERSYIHYALNKYGVENFTFNIVERPKEENLNNREQYWIRFWHTCIYDEQCNGYNLTWGGEGSQKNDYNKVMELWDQGFTQKQIREKSGYGDISVRNALYVNGITHEEIMNRGQASRIEKAKKKIYQYTLNGEFVKEWESTIAAQKELGYNNAVICNCLKGNLAQAYNFLWVYSPEDLKMALERYNKKKAHRKNRPVGQFDLKGNFIREYISAAEAAKTIGHYASHIRDVCKNKPGKLSAGGFKWKYMDEIES